MTFTTQKEIWEHLIANEGKPCVKCCDYGHLYGFKDGAVICFSLNQPTGLSFVKPSDWQSYTEPEPCWLEHETRNMTIETRKDLYVSGAKELAYEAIKRIEAAPQQMDIITGVVFYADAISILKNLIGDRDGK
jgi:hypothetical protein